MIWYPSDGESVGSQGGNAPQDVTQPDQVMVEDRNEPLLTQPNPPVTEGTDVAMLPASSELASNVSNLAPNQEFAAGAFTGSNVVPTTTNASSDPAVPPPADDDDDEHHPPMMKMDMDSNVPEHDKIVESNVPTEPPQPEEQSADPEAADAKPAFLEASTSSSAPLESNVETEVVSHPPIAMQVEPSLSSVNEGLVQNVTEEKNVDDVDSSHDPNKEVPHEDHVDEGQQTRMDVEDTKLLKTNVDEEAAVTYKYKEMPQTSEVKESEKNAVAADFPGWTVIRVRSVDPSGENGVNAQSAQAGVEAVNAHKIEADEAMPVASASNETQQMSETKEAENTGVVATSHTPMGAFQDNVMAQAPSPPTASTTPVAAQMSSPSNRPASPPRGFMRELRVEDALNYLDQVKVEFGSAPRIYNEFLEIMKHFKAHEIDTPGVIMRVSELFSGYNNLILGFNTFLPEGYQISLKDLQEGGKYCRAPRRPEPEMNVQRPSYPVQPPQAQQPQPGMPPKQVHQHPVGMHHQPHMMQAPPTAEQEQGEPPAAVEFDHAISYVTTIKRRFANEPRTYQQFLEILHTYQKEQRGIREVLEQVSTLFADHPDLLKQFTYFLPEAVQEQAKVRLHAAAAEAEARQAAAAAAAQHHHFPKNFNQQGPRGLAMNRGRQEIIDMTRSSMMQRSPDKAVSNVTMQYSVVPEAVVYNAAVERQYFDMAKEALKESTRDGETWNQFVKCIDLYAQEILNKSELLRYMEDLLGKQHADLYEEFKRILNAAGASSSTSNDDSWYFVPLADIDFKRCRRCSPSYRALPRDYPVSQFSGRSEEDLKLLNDVWISLPDGNEETYTFRHMRKNQHEENLFRIEDERFEIDMVIDSTATALKRLEAIAEEIAVLQQKESFSSKLANSSEEKMRALSTGGLAGKVIKFSFDKRILTTIHKHAIARIYGDAGQDMLDLLHTNPVVAIPVVVKRLSQKLKDFIDAREVLNVRWMELAQANYYKSFDHRSLTWRTVDKRLTSTRTLLSEIKDRAANDGVESDATVLSNKNKAKEDYGSFYHATMGRYTPRKMDLKNLPRPAPSMFTPHYSMIFENNSSVQCDAYRILSFALERSSSSSDKEKSHRIWLDFLAPFFGLSKIWMQNPAVTYAAKPHHTEPAVVSGEEESANDEDESSDDENGMVGDMHVTEEVMQSRRTKEEEEADIGFNLLDNQPIPTGVAISTVFGEGTIVSCRESEKTYVVALPFGTAYLNQNAVLCTILPLDRFPGLQEDMDTTDEEGLERDDDKIMLGPQSLYLFFRLYQVLVYRLNVARKLAFTVDEDQSLRTLIDHMNPDGSMTVGQKRYNAFLGLIYELVDGGTNASTSAADGGKYEDRLRSLLGHHSYELSTMDKLIAHVLKHMQQMANDDTFQGMIQIFRKQMDKGCFKPVAFRQEAAMISEGETVYAFQYCKIPDTDNTLMHIELLGCITDASSDEDSEGGDDKESLTTEISLEGAPAAKRARR
jgi:paired amphipathic helix protein Sin3a